MNEIGLPIETRGILEDLALALMNHDTLGMSATYIDLTVGEVITLLNEDELWSSSGDDSMIPKWQKEYLEDLEERKKHDMFLINPIPSYESFGIMESFAETCDSRQQDVLWKALRQRHPFSKFRQAVERLGILQSWYDYKQEAELKMAEEWLHENDLTIKDGKIGRKSE